MQILDLMGASLSLAATFAFVQAHPSAWKYSLAAIAVNTILYEQNQLQGQVLLEIYYAVTTLYGWYTQQQSHLTQRLYIDSLTNRQSLQFILVLLLGIALCSSMLDSVTQATILLCGIGAQGLTSRRILQAWPLWVITDILVAIVHYDAQLPFHSVLHLVYLGMAFWGYKSWKTLLNDQEEPQSVAA